MDRAGESIGERVRRLRRERGLSQRALATTGVSYAHISKIEVGERDPSMKALRALADRLGVSVEYLETGRELRDPQERELRLGEAELILRLEADTTKAESLFRAVLEDAVPAGDSRDAARARVGLGFVAAHRGDHRDAIASLEPVVAEPWVTARSHPDVFATLGHSYASVGRAAEAVELLRGAIDTAAAQHPLDTPALVRLETYLSYALSDLGDLDGARAAIARALRHANDADDAYTRVRLYWSNARLASADGDHDLARLSIGRAIALLEASEHTAYLGRAHLLAAEFATYEGDDEDAREHLAAAGAIVSADSEVQDQAWLRIQRALLAARSGDAATAIDEASEAIELLDEHEDPTLRGRAQWALGEALAAAGTRTAARAAFDRASSLIPAGSKYAEAFVSSWSRCFPADAEAGVG